MKGTKTSVAQKIKKRLYICWGEEMNSKCSSVDKKEHESSKTIYVFGFDAVRFLTFYSGNFSAPSH